MFEEQAREAQRSAYIALIDTAHAAGERLEPALKQAVEHAGDDPAATLFRDDLGFQRRRDELRINLLSVEHAAFRTALARVELEGPEHLIPLATEIDTAIKRAEHDCASRFHFLVAHHRLDKASRSEDTPTAARSAASSALHALRRLSLEQTPSLTPAQRASCVSFRLSPADRDIRMGSIHREQMNERAAVLHAEHPEECDALLRAYTRAMNEVGRAVVEGAISQRFARTLKLRAARGREEYDAPFTPWDQIYEARVRFTDAARDYLHTMPSPRSHA
ncbi:hypothetical protein [Streptomyces pristinaespiralis]|uniref:hypothetical protein n=1 Tax=Streptomyces pristinaespiralis TaxID=38300 RepID=UPI00384DF896